MFNPTPKKSESRIVIKATLKVALGHQPHHSGVGVQLDRRTRRCRTRRDQDRKAIREYA